MDSSFELLIYFMGDNSNVSWKLFLLRAERNRSAKNVYDEFFPIFCALFVDTILLKIVQGH